ncbi:MAG: transketolase [Gemmatimonadota bacterium]|nr:transketolase [Gemmatimonadota bacterium]
MPASPSDILAVNTLRALALDAVANAKEGHPGGPVGMSPMAYVLFTRIMRYNPRDPKWPNRDRFILSAGHASMLIYGALHLTGYDVSMDDLKNFRQWGSHTPGHPEYGHTPGVETTTGPLGQGFANAVGFALAEAHLGARYNRPGHALIDHYTYGICSDGDLMEGISHEAASFAGHLGLGKLIMLYDDNLISLDGPTEWTFTDDTTERFESYGWHVQMVDYGNTDFDGIEAAVKNAQNQTERPSLIRIRTTIGLGLPKQGTADVHGKAPSLEDVIAAKKSYSYPSLDPFFLPDDGVAPWREAGARGAGLQSEWKKTFDAYRAAFSDLAGELDGIFDRRSPKGLAAALPTFDPTAKPMATRVASGQTLNALEPKVPAMIGGSADLRGSNDTVFKGSGFIDHGKFGERNINFGVREHAMCAIGNGLALNGMQPYVATFLIFSDYCKNAIRLSSLMGQPTIFIFTHDSIGLGTDGPTHQPVEQLAGLRAIPGMHVIRPADANETAVAWQLALERVDGPTLLALSRQNVPVLAANAAGTRRGGYVAADSDGAPELILIATGTEVHLALEGRKKLAEQGVRTRVVSMPCWEIFAAQDQGYRDGVIPPGVRARIGIEAASSFGWERWVGLDGATIALNRFGASAPGEIVMRELGFTVENVVATGLRLLGRGGSSSPGGDSTPQAKPTAHASGHS